MAEELPDPNTVDIVDIISRRRSFVLPTACPECGADLTFPHAIRAHQFVFEFQRCSAGNEEKDMEWYSSESGGDAESMAVRYECTRCEHALAESVEGTISGPDSVGSRLFESIVELHRLEKEDK